MRIFPTGLSPRIGKMFLAIGRKVLEVSPEALYLSFVRMCLTERMRRYRLLFDCAIIVSLEMTADEINVLKTVLEGIVGREGFSYLEDSPMKVFDELLNSGAASRRTASALLHTLLMKIPEYVKGGSGDLGEEEVSAKIQKECLFKKRESECFARVYLRLFSKENGEKWEKEKYSGLRSFVSKEWKFTWKGDTRWETRGGSVGCEYEATMKLSPIEGKVNDKKLDKMLSKNPFLSEEDIADHFFGRLRDYLDEEFEDYCTSDDYYEPVCEDFEAEYYASEWCQKHGFEILSFTGEGFTGDYEPDLRGY